MVFPGYDRHFYQDHSANTLRNRTVGAWLRGRTAMLFLTAACFFAIPAHAQFSTLLTFNGTDGTAPYSALVQGTDGNLYGTTSNGGANGRGTVFKLTPGGTITTLYNFCSSSNCVDGAVPQAGLTLGADGNFYGTTLFGGTGTTACGSGCGTAFKITPAGVLTTLHSFCVLSSCLDGDTPQADLVQGADGNFYGTTPSGGAYFQGTVFKMTPAGVVTTLYAFCRNAGCTDGATPLSGLVQGANGLLYGTTADGGLNFYGEVFSISTTGTFNVVHNFDQTDGSHPSSTLIQASNGLFFGAAQGGGTSTECGGGCGVLFAMTPAGTFPGVLNFNYTDGAYPEYAAMVQASDGKFYGTTAGGGSTGDGTVFRLTPTGALTTLYVFCTNVTCPDGEGVNSIMQATNGILYGTTAGGGITGDGTIFMLSENLPAFVVPLPAFGRVGARINIMGNGFTGASSVTFNGTPATFTVVSSTLITATVPSGATSGKITVTTSTGTLASKVSFRVQ